VVVAFHVATLTTGRALPLTRTGLSPVGTRQLSWRTEDRLRRQGIAAEWGDILRDLDRLQEIELEQDGKRFLLRTPTTGVAGKLFQAVGVALPPHVQELPLPTSQSPA
jgi:hypothetical protein